MPSESERVEALRKEVASHEKKRTSPECDPVPQQGSLLHDRWPCYWQTPQLKAAEHYSLARYNKEYPDSIQKSAQTQSGKPDSYELEIVTKEHVLRLFELYRMFLSDSLKSIQVAVDRAIDVRSNSSHTDTHTTTSKEAEEQREGPMIRYEINVWNPAIHICIPPDDGASPTRLAEVARKIFDNLRDNLKNDKLTAKEAMDTIPLHVYYGEDRIASEQLPSSSSSSSSSSYESSLPRKVRLTPYIHDEKAFDFSPRRRDVDHQYTLADFDHPEEAILHEELYLPLLQVRNQLSQASDNNRSQKQPVVLEPGAIDVVFETRAMAVERDIEIWRYFAVKDRVIVPTQGSVGNGSKSGTYFFTTGSRQEEQEEEERKQEETPTLLLPYLAARVPLDVRAIIEQEAVKRATETAVEELGVEITCGTEESDRRVIGGEPPTVAFARSTLISNSYTYSKPDKDEPSYDRRCGIVLDGF
ncbi:hypothetical protein F5Y17DRAFT_456982 [Xylariaceae sp. FL0594]|nr:hypothetical protein F5Y17DRAFT_456982 [Xylariaceae sp. FL0594]